MNHQPTQLALLISLIGVGVSPYANASARLDDRASGAVQSLPGVTCEELEAASMQTCGTAPDQVWQLQRSTLDLPATAGVRLLYSSPRDDWAPGELADGPGELTSRPSSRAAADVAPSAVVQAAPQPIEAREAPRSTTRKQASGKTRKVRTIAKAPSPARVNAKSLARADAAIERIERIELVEKVKPKRADPAVAESAPSEASTSAQSERLLDNLIAILQETPVAAPAAPEPVAAPTGDAGRTEVRARLRDATQAQIERPPIVVETQASVVLRSLGAILSEERDEVGAIRPEAPDAAVTTQTGKVIAMLGEIATAPPAIEDGPARRLRKLAVRAAKIEAAATADAAAAAVTRSASELAAEIAENGVDLMLPLEPPVFAATLSADAAEAPPPIEPVPSAAPTVKPAVRAARAKPFGDRQVAVSESSLDRVRGGFAFDGLNISFGIERAVYVNGALVTTTSLNVSDLGRITAGTGTGSFDIRSMGLVQSGAGNVLSPTSVSAGSISTVVQNTLDGQKIQNVTVINATVNSLGVLKGLNLQSSLRGAVIDSLRR